MLQDLWKQKPILNLTIFICIYYIKHLLYSGKGFSHVRMQDNVEINNPMYQDQELDEEIDRDFTIETETVSLKKKKQSIICCTKPNIGTTNNVMSMEGS